MYDRPPVMREKSSPLLCSYTTFEPSRLLCNTLNDQHLVSEGVDSSRRCTCKRNMRHTATESLASPISTEGLTRDRRVQYLLPVLGHTPRSKPKPTMRPTNRQDRTSALHCLSDQTIRSNIDSGPEVRAHDSDRAQQSGPQGGS